MIEAPTLEWMAIAPELLLGIATIVVLLLGTVAGATSRLVAPLLSIAALIGAIALAVVAFPDPHLNAFAGQIDSDRMANVVRVLAAAAGIVTIVFSMRTRTHDGREGEHYSLILAAVAGMGLFGAAGSLVTLFVGIELFSIALYVLCALEAERVAALEAGLKYLIVGGLGAAVLLYGSALVYGATGTFDLSDIGAADGRGPLLALGAAMVIAALLFKASAAPLHWWTPDVYDGSATSVAAFMATATKAAAFAALARVLVVSFGADADDWRPPLAAVACASILVGNIGALVQDRVKRMLAYSSIAHAGYLLIGVVAFESLGVSAMLYALAAYVAASLAAFAVVLVRQQQIAREVTFDDLRGAGWTWVASGVAMTLAMLSFAGIPPTGGFLAKFALFQAAIRDDYAWLAVVGVVGSVISLVYYLRIPVAMYMRDGEGEPAMRTDGVLGTVAVLSALVAVGLGLVPDGTLDVAQQAAERLVALGR